MTDTHRKIGGIVLCGGGSRRMGRPKAWLPWGDGTLLTHVVRIVSSVTKPVVVAAAPHQDLPNLPNEVRIVPDAIADAGPLAGIAAGFDALPDDCEAAFVTACDHPLLKPAFIERLIDLLHDHSAVIPTDGQRWHPLTAVYRLNTRPLIDEVLSSSAARATTFAELCRPLIVTADAIGVCDPNLESLRNTNNQAAYHAIRPESQQ